METNYYSVNFTEKEMQAFGEDADRVDLTATEEMDRMGLVIHTFTIDNPRYPTDPVEAAVTPDVPHYVYEVLADKLNPTMLFVRTDHMDDTPRIMRGDKESVRDGVMDIHHEKLG